MTKNEDDRALVYGYYHYRLSGTRQQDYSKTLVVSFNQGDVVTDVEFWESGRW